MDDACFSAQYFPSSKHQRPFWWTLVSQARPPSQQWCSTLMLAQAGGFGYWHTQIKGLLKVCWRCTRCTCWLVNVCKFWIPVSIWYQIVEGAPCQGYLGLLFALGDCRFVSLGSTLYWWSWGKMYRDMIWALVYFFTSLASRPNIPTFLHQLFLVVNLRNEE